MKNDLDSLLAKIKSLCQSIILIGSAAERNATSESDVDLILLVENDSLKKTIRNIIGSGSHHGHRMYFDCKIYTITDFMKTREGQDHFFLWNASQKAEILYGGNEWFTVKLNPSKVIDELWTCMDTIDESCNLLETQIQFTGSCFKLFSSLKTIYFAEISFLERKSGQKEQFLRTRLDNQYDVVHDRYLWVTNHLADQSLRKLKVPTSIDRKITEIEYLNLYEISLSIREYAKTMIPQLVSRLGQI